MDEVKRSRPYVSARRREQSAATRQRILGAAQDLFIRNGYAATSISTLAARASVSAETIYATFGAKRAILAQLVDAAIGGGADAPPIRDQEWVHGMRREPDPRRRLAALARQGSHTLARRAALDEVVRSAAGADADIAALWRKNRDDRYAGQRALLQIALRGAALRKGLTFDEAADVVYAVGSPETYLSLVFDRGWTRERFERWYAEILAGLPADESG
jgi:AcrR family transcriptional regulator